MPTPADQIPEYTQQLTENFGDLNNLTDQADSIPGLPDINNLLDPSQLTSLISLNDIPEFLPSVNPGSFGQIASSLTNIATNPFAIFDSIGQIKDTICNFEIPIFTVPDYESLFKMKFEDIEKKFLSLLPDFSNPPNLDIEELMKKTAKMLEDKIVSAFNNLYQKLFVCQPKDD
jgi:hypothetical protein